jgi:three-Cys-motif partner protein
MARKQIGDIGPWSEVKLAIINDYAAAYSRILSAQRRPRFTHVYIDAFAGSGEHSSRTSGHVVPGSPMLPLRTKPPFLEYHFIDLDQGSIDHLRKLVLAETGTSELPSNVRIYNDDCNDVLLSTVFPSSRYEDYRRALCLLDPYGLHLDWEVVKEAGRMKSMEIFLNFPIADMNRNVLWKDADSVDPGQVERMTRFWGDESWREAAYSVEGNLFGFEEKQSNAALVNAYRHRLKEVAGFLHVPKPMPMRNSRRADVYYLFFASQKPTAQDIVNDIFDKYGGR